VLIRWFSRAGRSSKWATRPSASTWELLASPPVYIYSPRPCSCYPVGSVELVAASSGGLAPLLRRWSLPARLATAAVPRGRAPWRRRHYRRGTAARASDARMSFFWYVCILLLPLLLLPLPLLYRWIGR